MIKIACNICKRDLPLAGQNVQTPMHFCDRCLPDAEIYVREVAQLCEESANALNKAIDRHRGNFIANRQARLKVVSGESQKATG